MIGAAVIRASMRHRIGHSVKHALLDYLPRFSAHLNYAADTAHIGNRSRIAGGPLQVWTSPLRAVALRRGQKPSTRWRASSICCHRGAGAPSYLGGCKWTLVRLTNI